MDNDTPKTIYRCYYEMQGYPPKYVDSYSGIAVFKNGFWIDKFYKICFSSDAWRWIPASRILHIEKVPEDD